MKEISGTIAGATKKGKKVASEIEEMLAYMAKGNHAMPEFIYITDKQRKDLESSLKSAEVDAGIEGCTFHAIPFKVV